MSESALIGIDLGKHTFHLQASLCKNVFEHQQWTKIVRKRRSYASSRSCLHERW
jgi:hypothetical protein